MCFKYLYIHTDTYYKSMVFLCTRCTYICFMSRNFEMIGIAALSVDCVTLFFFFVLSQDPALMR